MPLYFVNGSSGSGKTTVLAELLRLGYDAYDADDRSIGGSFNMHTGAEVQIPPASERTPEWLDSHRWKFKRQAVEKLKEKAKDKPIFICGSAGNEDEVWDLFDKVLHLHVDEETLRKRILRRTENDFGKNEFEMNQIMEWHRGKRKENEKYGAVIIDASKDIGQVVQEILTKVKS